MLYHLTDDEARMIEESAIKTNKPLTKMKQTQLIQTTTHVRTRSN